VRIRLPSGSFHTGQNTVDSNWTASEIYLEGEEGAALIENSEGFLFQLIDGSPKLHLHQLHLNGSIIVNGGRLQVTNCTFARGGTFRSDGPRSYVGTKPGLSLLRGTVIAGDTLFMHQLGGAISVSEGMLLLSNSTLRLNHAERGAGLYVTGGHVDVHSCAFEDNEATVVGGAMQVDGGDVTLSDMTMLIRNRAPSGGALGVGHGANVRYSLPAPLGRWIYIPTVGMSSAFFEGGTTVDGDYPFACSAGVMGNSLRGIDQSGPLCSGYCPSGYVCRGSAFAPEACIPGHYCGPGSPAASPCSAGTHSNVSRADSAASCAPCTPGHECTAGSAVPSRCQEGSFAAEPSAGKCTLCAPGKYQDEEGQSSCKLCVIGAHCGRGASAPTWCEAGSYSDTVGLDTVTGCKACSLGHACSMGTSTPDPCSPGRFGDTLGQRSRECAGPCSPGHWCPEGSTNRTSRVCPPGRYNSDIGGTASSACKSSPEGTCAPAAGADEPQRCSVGHVQSAKGQTQCVSCASGEHQPHTGEAYCLSCTIGQYSVSGSAYCDICAETYYRPHANSSAHACESCSSLDGLLCPLNSTVETLQVQPGWWRLSPHSTRAYKCASQGNTSVCVGGSRGGSLCAPDHKGPLCKVCSLDDHYFDDDDAKCVRCEPVNGAAVAAVVVAIVFGLLGVGGLTFLHQQHGPKYDRYGAPLRRWVHAVKARAQSVGIVGKLKSFLAFAQVAASIQNTYSVVLPDFWYQYTSWIRVFGALEWTNWLMPSACVVGAGIVETLLLRAFAPLALVIAMPLVGAAVSVAHNAGTPHAPLIPGLSRQAGGSVLPPAAFVRPSSAVRSTLGNAAHRRSLKHVVLDGFLSWLPASFILAFCFTPSVSAAVFRAWHCISFSYDDLEEHSFLEQDLSVRCDGSDRHKQVLAVAWGLVAIWPIGMVLLYVVVLLPCRFMLLDGKSVSPLLRATAFLHRDYRPSFFWWEVASLHQRNVLCGWLLLIDVNLPFIRLIAALVFSVAFLVALLSCRPHRRRLEHLTAAGCQVLLISLFICGIMVHLFEEISRDSAGSTALAYRFLGLRSSEEAVMIMIGVSFAMVALLALAIISDVYAHEVQQRLESKWSVCTLDPPFVHRGWRLRGIYACFLSHYKMEAASDARYMHDMFRKMLKAPVFLDSSTLNDLRDLITEGVHKSDTLILLATRGVLARPWCLLELLETAREGIPVVVVQMANGGFTFDEAHRFMTNLEGELDRVNPSGANFLRERLGDLAELKAVVLHTLDANEGKPLVFDSHAGDHAMVATMKDVVERMAASTRRKIEWRGSSPTLHFGTASLAQQIARTIMRANSVESWRSSALRLSFSRESRAREQDVSNVQSAVFVCCSREDAVQHARVLRAALSLRLRRACAVGGGADTADFVPESELFVVLLTRKLLDDPSAIHEIWLALQRKLPLVSIAIAGAGYDFAEANEVLSDLTTSLSTDLAAEAKGKRASSRKTKQSTAVEDLQRLLPDGVTVDAVGEALHTSLTAVIALAWTPAGSKNHLDAVVDDILERLPKAKAPQFKRRGSSPHTPGGSPARAATARHLAPKSPRAADVQLQSSTIDVRSTD